MTDYRTEVTPNAVTHVEDAAQSPLTLIDLTAAAAKIQQRYKNVVLVDVNDHCVRMAVMEGEYRWHYHPHSDECFLVIEGRLEIDLDGGQTIQVNPGQAFNIPSRVIHRTRAKAPTVNLCFENRLAYTDVVFVENPSNK